jgi:hypothetical protein
MEKLANVEVVRILERSMKYQTYYRPMLASREPDRFKPK